MGLNYDMTVLMLIVMRLTGCIIFNTIFGRRSVPIIFRIGLVLFMSYYVYEALPVQQIEIGSVMDLMFVLAKEMLLGFIFGFIIQIFTSVVILAGEFIDLQIGISMAKIYDPQTNASVAISASLLNIMFMLIFFAVNGHLTLLRVFLFTFKAIPLGATVFAPDFFKQLAGMLSYTLVYAVKLVLPVLAAELITEIGVGIIMKAVPQINVFIVNLQLKIILGFAIFMILLPPYASFLDRLITIMFEKMDLLFQMIPA